MGLRCAMLLLASLLVAGCSLSDTPGEETPAPLSLPIGKIQGRTQFSEYANQAVVLQGVVTGNFVTGLDGFFMQDAIGEDDADPATSDGIFVAWPHGSLPKVRRGDRVRVSGEVREIERGPDSSQTTLQASAIEVLGRGAATVTELSAPPVSVQDWERLEGMWLRITTPLTVSGNEGLLRFGELIAVFGPRQYQPTHRHAPGPAARKLEQDNRRRRLVLDDNRRAEYPDRLWYLPEPLSASAPMRVGSVLHGVEGILHDDGDWYLQLTDDIKRIEQAPRPPRQEWPELPQALRVTSFNLFNWFNGDGAGHGFPAARGAASAREAKRQRDKLVAAIRALEPDLAALMEVENDGHAPESSLAQLIDALNAAWPEGGYRLIDAGHDTGQDAIRVAMIYRESRLTPVGTPRVPDDAAFITRNRLPLLQAFRAGEDGPVFNFVANHFKSKICNEAKAGDADQGDGQACWNETRTRAAQALDAWLKTDPGGNGSAETLIVGDLNSHTCEQPLRLLRSAGWKDVFELAGEPLSYSYIYRGNSGRFDHALLSPALAPRLRAAQHWHINADETEAFDYRLGQRDPSWYAADPYRSSDHDPLILLLDFSRR